MYNIILHIYLHVMNSSCYNRNYHIYAENNPNCFNESSDRISSLKNRVIINDACKRVEISGLTSKQLVTKYPNYQVRNSTFKTSCNLLK